MQKCLTHLHNVIVEFFLAQFYSIGSPNSKEKNCLFLALYML